MLRKREPAAVYCDVLAQLAKDWFVRSAKAAHDLNLEVVQISARVRPCADALDALPQKRSTCLLEGPTGTGMIVFDAELLDALIEQQTLGEVLRTPRADRPVTSIDLSMSEPFRDTLLEQLRSLVEDTRCAELGAFTVLRFEADRVRLGIELEAAHYEVLNISLDVGPGQKMGLVQFWVPVSARRRSEPCSDTERQDLLKRFGDVDVPLKTVLPGLKVSVNVLRNLGEGSILPLDSTLISKAVLQDSSGRKVGQGQLGQINGKRAFRVNGTRRDALEERRESSGS